MPAEDYARSPCERFPAGAFSVAPCGGDRCSPPPPAPLPDRFVPSPRRVRRGDQVDRQQRVQRRTRYVPPAAHIPVERYVPRPPLTTTPPLRAPPPFYCTPGSGCRPARKCCPAQSCDGSPPARYVEYSRVSCTTPPVLGLTTCDTEPACCLQARRRPPPHEWRPLSQQCPATPQSPPSCHTPPQQPIVTSSHAQTTITSLPSTSVSQREQTSQTDDLEDGVKLRRAHSLVVKDYIKRETQTFFGVQPDNEREQKRLWRERRKRHAARTLGNMKIDVTSEQYRDDDYISMYGASGVAPREARGRPDVLPADVTSIASVQPPPKDSVARLTLSGLSYVVMAMSRRARQSTSTQMSRSFRMQDLKEPECDDVFFTPPPSPVPHQETETDSKSASGGRSPLVSTTSDVEYRRPTGIDRTVSWGPSGRIHAPVLDTLIDNSNRRQFGMGVVGRFFKRSIRKSVAQQEDIAHQLDCMTDYRPYFTWWVSTVQTLVLILSILCYGFGPVGFGRHTQMGQVLMKSLSLQQVEFEEPASFWLGPRASDLIHLGAKFAPCMRRDSRIARAIAAGARRERDTACCIRNDDSGCVQSSRADCSNTISTWKKWSNTEAGPGGRISGSVCGLDPKYCEAPASIAPYEWPDDITKWPICRKARTSKGGSSSTSSSVSTTRAGKTAEHMACEVIGHPCCIGIYGQCVITTREYCDFVHGYFHEEASLCSQVSCLDDVCGMLPFMIRRRPDQLYRVWTSLFVHAGILHLSITLALQWLLMRDLEKMAGPVRVAVIYLGSGVTGNLASAMFEPYTAEVGPAGAHFGLLACLIVEVFAAWPLLKRPKRALAKLLLVAFLLFIFGLLPWVDNYAHLFGFVFGFIISNALLPFITVGPYDRRKKVVLVWICLASAALLTGGLAATFYGIPAYECETCSYFTCIPFARDMCAAQDILVRSIDTV